MSAIRISRYVGYMCGSAMLIDLLQAYHVKLVAWSHCVRVRNVVSCNNGIAGGELLEIIVSLCVSIFSACVVEYQRLRFEPRRDIIAKLPKSTRTKVLSDVNGLFEGVNA